MASPDTTSLDLPLLPNGGLCTQYDPQTLPIGASPFNRNISFSGESPNGTGLVQGIGTRPGLKPFITDSLADNLTINYLKTFIDLQEVVHLLALDSFGGFLDETPCPTPPSVAPGVVGSNVPGSFAQSDTLFGKEWIALRSNDRPSFGIDIPRSWNGQFYDRVSQVGPGQAPSASDFLSSFNINTSLGLNPFNYTILAISEVGNIVTVTVSATLDPNTRPGDMVVIAGVSIDPLYDGTFAIASVSPSSNQFTYVNSAFGLAAGNDGTASTSVVQVFVSNPPINIPIGDDAVISGATDPTFDGTFTVRAQPSNDSIIVNIPVAAGIADSDSGTLSAGGNIPAGLRQVSVSFVTRTGYITKPAPFTSWTSVGSLSAIITNIPTGPPNIVARILMFTSAIIPPATGGDFFYFDGAVPLPDGTQYPSMVIQDNTTTSYVVNFDDTTLQEGTLATNLFNLLELGECASVLAYSNRTFWAGERNKLSNLNNLTFDGGFTNGSQSPPLGWILSPSEGNGGGSAVAESQIPYWGDAYVITGDGVAATRGLISQSLYQDFLGVPILLPNIEYSVRVRLLAKGSVPFAVGSFHIDTHSDSTAFTSAGLTVPATSVQGLYLEFIGQLLPPQVSIPSDLELRVYADGTVPLNSGFVIDCIEIFPTLTPYNNNVIRASYAAQPESFDAVTGFLQIGQAQNQSVRTMFILMDNKMYPVTERGMYSTQDDGVNEPNDWVINTLSATVGTGSVRGVAVSEYWAVIASRDGAYIFWGGEPERISTEIQPDWDNNNWGADQTIYATVDVPAQRFHIGLPSIGNSVPDHELVCDYSQLTNDDGFVSGQDIASNPQVITSGGGLAVNPKARRWTVWDITANSCALTLRSDGSYKLLRGNSVGNSEIYSQENTQLSDDGVAINAQYQFAFFPQMADELAGKLGPHRKLCKYMGGFANGAGTLSFTMVAAQGERSLALSDLPLRDPCQWDMEKNINFVAERMSLIIEQGDVGSWFSMTKLYVTIQADLITPVKGVY